LDTCENRSEIPGNFLMWLWRRMEKLSWKDYLRNEVLFGVKEKRNILPTIKKEG
jgi:hypothetical protein